MMPFSKPDWSTREVCISLWAALSFIGLVSNKNNNLYFNVHESCDIMCSIFLFL